MPSTATAVSTWYFEDGYKTEDVIEAIQRMRDERIEADEARLQAGTQEVLKRRYTTKNYTDDLARRVQAAGGEVIQINVFEPTEVSGL